MGESDRLDPHELFGSLSNWGRWGDGDRLGTLNLITARSRKSAAGLVTEGESVSCAWEIDPRLPDMQGAPQRFMLRTGEGLDDEDRLRAPEEPPGSRAHGIAEYIGLVFHGANVTHIDALSHVFWDGAMYGGRPANRVTVAHGAAELAITDVPAGVLTRGVLLDVARLRDVEWIEPGTRITPADLEAAEDRQGVRVAEGDAVLLRTGNGRRKRSEGFPPYAPGDPQAGWDASCLPWFRERGVALIGADTANDAVPSGCEASGMFLPVHIIGIVSMGLWLVDNCDLEALGDKCASVSRHEFCLSVAPLRFAGVTGSPVNPIATF